MDYSIIVTESEGFVRNLFRTFADKEYPYHNLRHTTEVVTHALEIAAHCDLTEADRTVVTVAAWYHDVGHLFGAMEEHEEVGVLIMKNHFINKNVSESFIADVAACIMATRVPTHPRTLDEMILCDADTYHFGTGYFRNTDMAIRQELEIRTGRTFPDWNQKSIRLLMEHRFYTDYCRKLLDYGKYLNLEWLRSRE